MSTVRIPRVGWDPCAGLRGGCPISVDPVESGTPAPSWMGSGGEWTPWRQFGARTELARLRVVSPPEQKLLSVLPFEFFCVFLVPRRRISSLLRQSGLHLPASELSSLTEHEISAASLGRRSAVLG